MPPPVDRADIDLAIVTPMANEEATCLHWLDVVLGHARGFRSVRVFVVVDGASRDRTFDLLTERATSEPRLVPIYDADSRCPVHAYLSGFRAARAAGCDWVLELDGGFSQDPAQMSRLFDAMEAGRDVVFGSRFVSGGSSVGVPWIRRLFSRGGTLLANAMLGTRLRDMTSGFELFSGPAMDFLLAQRIHSVAHFFQTELRCYCRHMDWVEVPISYRDPSPNIPLRFVLDSLRVLARLTWQRWRGTLPVRPGELSRG